MSNKKNQVEKTCNELYRLGVVDKVEVHKHSIFILIKHEENRFEDDYVKIKEKIKRNFEKKGYIVVERGCTGYSGIHWWLEVMPMDIMEAIDNCFE